MPDEASGLDKKQQNALETYREALKISKEYCQPYFQKWTRYYRLFAGFMAPEIQATYSQVMLWLAWSMIDEELPTALRTFLTNPDLVRLTAKDISLESSAQTMQRWISYQLNNVQRITRNIVPTYQSAYIFGTGYRFYTHKFQKRDRTRAVPKFGLMGVPEGSEEVTETDTESIIAGEYINSFNVFPSPSGSQPNDPDETGSVAAEYVIVQTWPTKEFIENEAAKGNFDKAQVKQFYAADAFTEVDPSEEFKTDLLNTGSAWNQFSAPEWIRRMRNHSKTKLTSRRRIGWYFGRDRWIVIGEDRFVLYDGKPLLDATPIAKFTPSVSLDNWFGIGLIEPTEDLILSTILNFNNRLDYMTTMFHPPTFYPEKLRDSLSEAGGLDFEPYSTHGYAHTQYPGGIANFIYRDRPPEITQQTFIEEGKMQGYLQQVIGQHPIQDMNSETATVGSQLINQGTARKMLRAINLDDGGVRDSVWLTLKLGNKFKNEDEFIRTGADEMPWEQIDHRVITDRYGIEINGMRHLAQAEEMFKRQVSIAPMLLNNPEIRGQVEVLRQLIDASHYDNTDLIINGPQSRKPISVGAGEQTPENNLPGGIPTSQNEFNSTQAQSSVGAGNVLV